MALSKDNPKNKLVDGKVLEHVLLLLKGYIDSNSKEPYEPIIVKNTDSNDVKELVYNIVYGKEDEKPEDDELINKDIPLVSYLSQLVDKKIDKSYETQILNYVTEEEIVDMFKHAGIDTDLEQDDFECLKHLVYASEEDIYNIFEKEEI